MPRIEMSKLVEKMDLKNLTPDVDLSWKDMWKNQIVNRPALQLTGFFDHFDANRRIQIIGYVEYTFLRTDGS